MPLGRGIALATLALDTIQVLKTTDTGLSAWPRLVKFLRGQVSGYAEQQQGHIFLHAQT